MSDNTPHIPPESPTVTILVTLPDLQPDLTLKETAANAADAIHVVSDAEAVASRRRISTIRFHNILVMLMMLGILFLVIVVDQSFTKYLTGERPMPLTGVAGRKPRLLQLRLDAAPPYTLPALPEHKLDREIVRAAERHREKRQAKETAESALVSAQQAVAPLEDVNTKAVHAQEAVDKSKAALTAADTDLAELRAAVARQYANRLVYLAFTILYFLMGPLTLCVGLSVMWNTLRIYPPWTEQDSDLFRKKAFADPARRNFLKKYYKPSHVEFSKVFFAAIMAMLVAGGVFQYIYQLGPGDMQQLLVQTIQHDLVAGEAGQLTSAFDAYSMAIVAFLGAVAVCVAWHPRFRDPTCVSDIPIVFDPEQEACYMALQLKQLRLVVYIGTVVLIVRIVQLNAGLNWALAFVTPQTGPLYESIKSLVSSLVTVRAVYHTILLAAIYFPIAAVLSGRIAAFADSENVGKTAAERKNWLDAHGLNFDFGAQVPSLIAVISPLLTSPLKDLLGRIGL